MSTYKTRLQEIADGDKSPYFQAVARGAITHLDELNAELTTLRAENERLREALQRVYKSGSHSSARIHDRLALNPANKADSVEHCMLCETPYSYHHDCSCGLCKSSADTDVVFGLRSALCLIADMCDDPVMRSIARQALDATIPNAVVKGELK